MDYQPPGFGDEVKEVKVKRAASPSDFD